MAGWPAASLTIKPSLYDRDGEEEIESSALNFC